MGFYGNLSEVAIIEGLLRGGSFFVEAASATLKKNFQI